MLRDEINRGKEIPSLDTLIKCIISEIDGNLSAGKIDEAYVKDFLAV